MWNGGTQRKGIYPSDDQGAFVQDVEYDDEDNDDVEKIPISTLDYHEPDTPHRDAALWSCTNRAGSPVSQVKEACAADKWKSRC